MSKFVSIILHSVFVRIARKYDVC